MESREAHVVGQAIAVPEMPILWDVLLPLGHPSQAFEQDWEESWVV